MVSCTNAFQGHSVMQPYFNSADVLTFDLPLLADTKYLCWIKPIMKCLHRPKSNANGIFQIVYNYFSPLSVQFFFLWKIRGIVSLIHIQFCSRNDRSEKECNGGKIVSQTI